MRITLLCSVLLISCFFLPHSLFGKIQYDTLDADSSEVQDAAEEAVKRLGPSRGAVDIQRSVIDIIGIPTGMSGAGVAISGQVADIEQALKELGATVTETEIRIELPSDILFDFDKYNIRPDARDALKKVGVVLRAHSGKIALIEGHTDSMGSDDYNIQLSLKRADSVKEWLQEQENIKGILFKTEGWGESKPKATNETDEGRQENRRVEITIQKN